MSAAGHVDGRWTPIGARTMALARQYNLRHAADSATKGPSVDDEVLKHRTAARGRHIDWCVLPLAAHPLLCRAVHAPLISPAATGSRAGWTTSSIIPALKWSQT